MFTQVRKSLQQSYPRQFWLLVIGMLISTSGSSMIWPFLTIYVSERLEVALAQVTLLMTLNSIVGLASSFIAGPIVDKVGRKWGMVVSLGAMSVYYVLMSRADSWGAFAVLMSLSGFINPLYQISSDAMMADIIPPEKRADAFSLTRMSYNIGVALGPTIGGFVAQISYSISFSIAAAGMMTYCILLAALARETIPSRQPSHKTVEQPQAVPSARGYGRVLRDKPYMLFVLSLILTYVCVSMIWVLMSVYSKQNYGISEKQYGLLPATNALMVIFFQLGVTQLTKRFQPLRVLAAGALLYALAVGGVSLASGFWGFWICMVIMTIGELMLVPTAASYAANKAPADLRGRYMSLYGFGWGAAYGIGPLLGGTLNDRLGPKYIWYGGSLVGMGAVLIFSLLAWRYPLPPSRSETGLPEVQ